MGDALIVPAIGISIVTDKVSDVQEATLLNCDRRQTIRIAWERLNGYQELALCQLIQKMSDQANINHTYVKTVNVENPDTKEIESWVFNLPRQSIQTKDKDGHKITIHPDNEDGYTIKATRKFWRDIAVADIRMRKTDSEEGVKDFMSELLNSLGATADKNPTIEQSQQISWWGRLWKNTKMVFYAIMALALIVLTVWAFITFLWPVVLAGMGYTIVAAPANGMAWAAPSAGAIFAAVGVTIGSAAVVSIPAGALITTCTKPK